EHGLLTADRHQLRFGFNGKHPLVFRDVLKLTAPTAFLDQALLERGERGSPNGRSNERGCLLPQGFGTAVSVELLAPAIPLDNPAVKLEGEDRRARQLDELRLPAQVIFAAAQRLFHLPSTGYIQEGRDDAVDLVVDRAVRT